MNHSCGTKQETSWQKGISTKASLKSGEDLEVMDICASVKYSVKGNKIPGCTNRKYETGKGRLHYPSLSHRDNCFGDHYVQTWRCELGREEPGGC